MSRSILWLLTAVALSFELANATPAAACSIAAPPHVNDLEPGVEVHEGYQPAVVGIYEIEYLARSPRLLISGPRAVTIVTRYWGAAPAHLGLEMTGMDAGLWTSSNCGDMTQPAGTISYWYADDKSVARPDWGRSYLTLDGVEGSLTGAQEAMLAARFGEPVTIEVALADEVRARFMLWKWHLLALVVTAATWLFLRRRLRKTAATNA